MPKYLGTTSGQFIDLKLPQLQEAASILRQRPAKGWIHAIRQALGMSTTALARRLQTTHSAVLRYEKTELTGRVQLDTLRRVAEALDCELIVALVPRQPIADTLRDRAQEVAKEEFAATVNSMQLEDQQVAPSDSQRHFATLVENLLREPKKLWR